MWGVTCGSRILRLKVGPSGSDTEREHEPNTNTLIQPMDRIHVLSDTSTERDRDGISVRPGLRSTSCPP
ncbi:hypothetical protein CEP52_017554 [Fusarium oligoseptatum]|uniref:Uncharacterized protein n=1 Tax=Fusarium oligoseptatum TaxID=2604345 RepID=A0A428RNP8_9HYPO|nr:hypothetical protein CEP52_017554 [Fusarium oligoseptatum]